MKKKLTAFQTLLALEKLSAQMLGSGHDVADKSAVTWLGLGFESDHLSFVTKTNFIEAVIPVQTIYPLPMQISGLYGLSHYRNQLFTIIDLKAVFWQQESKISPSSRIILYRYYNQLVGILVCACIGLKRFENLNRQTVNLMPHIPYAHFVKYAFYENNARWAVLDIFKLINEICAGTLVSQATMSIQHSMLHSE